MKIAFFAGQLLPLEPEILDKKALGGTETGLVRLAHILAERGHEIQIFTRIEKALGNNPLYRPLAEVENAGAFDFFVGIRDWIPLFYKTQSHSYGFWTGDSYDQFANYGIGDQRISRRIEHFFCVSEWQANRISEESGFPRSKMKVIRNGVCLEDFQGEEKRQRKRLIYSSTPYRGLSHFLRYYPLLKAKHPDLEAHIFSSYQIYGQSDDQFTEMRSALEKLPDLHIHGNCRQSQLAREFMKSAILFYPNHFEETSCITAMEAMAGGAVVLSSALGALPETCGEAGVLIRGRPGEPAYDESFLVAADRLLSDDMFWTEKQNLGFRRAETLSWRSVADRFLEAISG